MIRWGHQEGCESESRRKLRHDLAFTVLEVLATEDVPESGTALCDPRKHQSLEAVIWINVLECSPAENGRNRLTIRIRFIAYVVTQ